ncbi:hypothetical protein JYA63_07340 [Fictibacillus nanhaiensis]|uniref:KTSC domain-containing protein n=1 Tax=Fictibacillus nanhaiensis TaxID=742169 RepID=A0ABS2ZMH0_9BACL|nr:hypothetical protein [Fictibacillus nanhaiensis]
MKRIKPTIKDNTNIPVNIYKEETLVLEALSIEQAASWLKDETGDSNKRFTAITKGIWYYEPYHYNGHTYFFETDPHAVVQYFERVNRKILTELTQYNVNHSVAIST